MHEIEIPNYKAYWDAHMIAPCTRISAESAKVVGSEAVYQDAVNAIPVLMTTKKHAYKIPFPETFDVTGEDNIPMDQEHRAGQILSRRSHSEHDTRPPSPAKGSWRYPLIHSYDR